VDEDTCATNFMIRDSKMMQLVAAEKEPITPFVRLVRSLHEQCGISCIMVIGGLGDYFHVADKVLVMDSYQCLDATERAMEIVAAGAAASNIDAPSRQQDVAFQTIRNRHAVVNKLDPAGKVKTLRKGIVSYGETEIDLTSVEQIVSASQTSAIASCLQKLATTTTNTSSGSASLPLCLRDQLEALDRALDQHGLDILAPGQYNGGLTRPRLLEVGAALNRIRRDGAVVQHKNGN
jgi:predicted ABC-class ATPase